MFHSIAALCLDRHLSDHRPILLREVHMDIGPIPFRFYHSWFDFVGFDDMIKLSWASLEYSNIDGMTRFKKKLKDLKVIIRRWVKTKRMEMVGSKLDTIAELEKIDKAMDIGVVDDCTVLHRIELKNNLLKLTEMEAKDRIQKSKVKWAVEGDENSKFFHGIINKRRSQLAIHGVFVDGIWRSDPRAVWNCGDNKSPGPDGFNFEFFKKYLDVVGSDSCEVIKHFFTSGGFFKGCNSSFVTLIPKIIDAKFVNDFRPISLIGCVYKVVTKVLANRLVSVIRDLVSDTQSAFVAGRQILDGPFILDEILKWCKRMGKQAMFFNVDFTKAYDLVRWDYLIDVLEAFGFGSYGAIGFGVFYILVKLQYWLTEAPLKNSLATVVSNKVICLLWVQINVHKCQLLGVGVLNTAGGRFYWMLNFEQLVSISRRDVPRGVLKALECIRNRFFNGADQSDHKITWFAWDKVLASK
nr:RNA-directed DNA polymerase, eukaryota, reverse transcriptase zinc-binding domain protein [Tanacetum cinerariifolium]